MTLPHNKTFTAMPPPLGTAPAAASTAHAVKVISVTTLEDLAQHGRAWNELVSASPSQLPMSSYAYVRPYYEHQMEPGESWRCLLAYAGPELVGVLPMVVGRQRVLGITRNQYRAPSNSHITSVTAQAAVGYEDMVLKAFLDELARVDPEYFSLTFARIHERATIFQASAAALADASVITELSGRGSYLPIRDDYVTYQTTLSSNHRRNLRRWAGRLEKLPDVKMSFLIGEAATDEAAGRFFELEASGWKGEQHSAILSCPRRAEFYRSMVRQMREAGWLEIHLLSTEGNVIAGQLAMRVGRALVVWKIAYDESYSACGPGNLLFAKTIERAYLQRDVDEINCLTDMDWHRAWRMSQRPYFDVTVYPRRTFTYLAGVMPKLARSIIRQVPGVRPLVGAMRSLLS